MIRLRGGNSRECGSVPGGYSVAVLGCGVDICYPEEDVYKRQDGLSAGMVGYLTASIKNVKDTRVGDTITDAANPCAKPLPGYKKVNPMV